MNSRQILDQRLDFKKMLKQNVEKKRQKIYKKIGN